MGDFLYDLYFVAFSVDEGFACDMFRYTFTLMSDFDFNFHEAAFLGFGGIGGQECVVGGKVLVGLEMGEPLERVGGNVQGMEDEEIVSMRSLLFPHFVLVIDDHLLLFVELLVRGKVTFWHFCT